MEIYTDGACTGNPGAGGYGAVLMYGGARKEIFGGYTLTTNNRMELMAVIKALEALKEKCKLNIYSDSRYVIDALAKGWAIKWRANNWMRTKKDRALNPDLWQKLLELLDGHKPNFIWVKGHASNAENNRCDELARNAIGYGELAEDIGYRKAMPTD